MLLSPYHIFYCAWLFIISFLVIPNQIQFALIAGYYILHGYIDTNSSKSKFNALTQV